MSGIYLSAVGMLGPGLPNWSIAREVLGGRRAYRQDPNFRKLSMAEYMNNWSYSNF